MASFPLHTTVEDHHTDQPEIRQSSRSEVPSEELHPKHLHGRSRRLPPPGLRGGSGRPECAGQAGRDVQDALSQALTSQRPFLLHLIAPRTPRFWSGIWNTSGFEKHDAIVIPDRL
jgi:hypothetical protein